MSIFKSNLLLLLAAAIWGFAFVAQRVGMEHIGPFAFNGVRFALGSLSLVPLILYCDNKSQDVSRHWRNSLPAGLLAGLVLFLGASLQQIGLVYTTAGKAAFITCLYIVLVPIFGIFLKHQAGMSTWLGSLLAVAGLYFLSIKESFSIAYGDLLELTGALFWSFHILIIDHFSRKVDVLKLACLQCITCSLLSLGTAMLFETITAASLSQALIPILYGGICSVGIAYTLQIVGQKHAPPSHAAIILSMETVFAVLGGFLLLDERLGLQEIAGCGLMLTGMLLSQLQSLKPAASGKLIERES
ncbi:MAG TPA: DMT family transporter [Methylomusa anaerophila]|uniref:Putative DMT superfamily transporter inner membrane protein n=1 Tax=Methylomusa anaerophila TaxID=1930071 RepID=A0A348AGT5_9FIRM|nr:DMT family transporter [Methylomusa anaerophila]BBB90283.1 putative DMT superfamily transporter inner membrane protein [Methylomusa anaerophila]HML89372.1 DMT family transporter [Methylomusa anaerophila]